MIDARVAAAFVVGSIIAIIALMATIAPYAFDKGQDIARALHADVVAEVRTEFVRR